MRVDIFHVLAAVKELHRELQALRSDIDEVKDELKVLERGGNIQIVLPGEGDESSSDEESSECESVQSAPATVSYYEMTYD